MKLKEYPTSLFHSLRLLLIPAALLGLRARPLDADVVVSLTSIPSRLAILHLTIRSLLAQSVRAPKIVLWLHEDLQDQLPARLRRLQGPRFEIRYGSQTCAHRKLVYSRQLYPAAVIVTCDDDQIYRRNWLQALLEEARDFPGEIVANQCRRVQFTESGDVAPYARWTGEGVGESHRWTLAIGYGGVVYPPDSLHSDAWDSERYLALAPRADDLWFKAMSLRQGTLTRRARHPTAKPIPIIFSQKERLGNTNIKEDGNRLQMQALLDAYELQAPTMRPETPAEAELASGLLPQSSGGQ